MLSMVLATIVRNIGYIIMILWLAYMFGMALANDICDCVKEWHGWWTIEYWTKEEGA